MPLSSEEDRERLAQTIYEAWSQGHLSDWEWVKRANCAAGWLRAADAVAGTLLPAGMVAIRIDEIAALRVFASAVLAHEALDDPTMEEYSASVLRVRAAIDGLQNAGFVPAGTVAIERELAVRLEQIEAAAREYAESCRAWGAIAGTTCEDRRAVYATRMAARIALVALFDGPRPEGA